MRMTEDEDPPSVRNRTPREPRTDDEVTAFRRAVREAPDDDRLSAYRKMREDDFK